jgi:hypothetical protein
MNTAKFGPSYSVTTLSISVLVSTECLKTSVAYVFKIKIGYFEVLRIPSCCEIKDVFYTFCRAKYDPILTDHEMVIWKIAVYLNEHGGFSEYNIIDMLLTAKKFLPS